VSRQYICRNCARRFQGHDAELIKKLPDHVQQAFPAKVFPKSALDKDLTLILQRQVVKGQSFIDFRQMINELKHEKYWSRHLEYISTELYNRFQKRDSIFANTRPIRAFGDFKNDWKGSVPTTDVLKRAFVLHSAETEELKNWSMMSLTGTILRGDHTFKVAKVPFQDHQRIFQAMYSLMNEYGQILGYWMVNCKSLNEIKKELEMVKRRYTRLGRTGPDLFYTDLCCSERSFWENLFESLRVGPLDHKTVPTDPENVGLPYADLKMQRVLLDSFHLMNRYPVSKLHPLYAAFMCNLRDAMFVVCPEDKAAVMKLLRKRNHSEEELEALPSDYFVRTCRVRRRIPPAAELSVRVNAVLTQFREIDPTFINDAVWRAHKSCMEHLVKGCLSDHPDVALYFEFEDEDNDNKFVKMRCGRGSSLLEGFHLHISEATAGKMVGPLLFDHQLREMIYRWNVDRSINARQSVDYGCYNLLLFERIHNLSTKHTHLFEGMPLTSYRPVQTPDGPTEKFGCSRILHQDILHTIHELENLPDADDSSVAVHELSLALLEGPSLDDEDDEIDVPVEAADDLSDLLQGVQLVDDVDPEIQAGIRRNIDVETVAKIKELPYPSGVKTREEVELYLKLFKEELVIDGTIKKVNMDILAAKWNQTILDKLTATDDANVVFQQYSFKTSYQLRAFNEYMDKKISARFAIHNYRDALKDLGRMLRHNDTVHLKAILIPKIQVVDVESLTDEDLEVELAVDAGPAGLETHLVPIPESRKAKKSAHFNASDLLQLYGSAIIRTFLGHDRRICSKCLRPEDVDHSSRACEDSPVFPSADGDAFWASKTKEQKKYALKTIQRQVARAFASADKRQLLGDDTLNT
jgi:hypothetical protein